MKKDLTEPQQQVLRHLAKYEKQWRQDTPAGRRCLKNLQLKGMIEVALDKSGWYAKITSAGIAAI